MYDGYYIWETRADFEQDKRIKYDKIGGPSAAGVHYLKLKKEGEKTKKVKVTDNPFYAYTGLFGVLYRIDNQLEFIVIELGNIEILAIEDDLAELSVTHDGKVNMKLTDCPWVCIDKASGKIFRACDDIESLRALFEREQKGILKTFDEVKYDSKYPRHSWKHVSKHLKLFNEFSK